MSEMRNETVADIVAEMRRLADEAERGDCHDLRGLGTDSLRAYADRIEAGVKREADSIHRAMVLIAGIEMEDSENPPRLWTALEDAYNALSDALGTDGEISADIEEAKAIGRHFVIKSFGNAAAMREALEQAQRVLHCAIVADILKGEDAYEALNAVSTALSAPPRNCDIMDWRTAWAKWRTECHPQKPCGYAEVVSGTEQFMDWYMSEAKGETK